MPFVKAEKKQAKLRLALTGPSGSGKTYSALKIAKGIGGKIAFMDTENHSASLYADEFQFDTMELTPPYTVDKYLDGINQAVRDGYSILVIDSISHAWAGEGGLLEKKGAIDARGGNSYTNWAPITREHEEFKARLLNCPIHLIVTMRSKQDYIVEQNDRGRSAPRKVGLAPIQREGMEYEFTMVIDMAMDHNAMVSKTRIRKFDNKVFKPTEETGKTLLKWLESGKEITPEEERKTLLEHMEQEKKHVEQEIETEKKNVDVEAIRNGMITTKQRKFLFVMAKKGNKTNEELKKFLKVSLGVDSTHDIPRTEFQKVLDWVKGK